MTSSSESDSHSGSAKVDFQSEQIITPDMVDLIVNEANPNWIVKGYTVKIGTQLGDNFLSIMYAVGIDVISKSSEGDAEVMEERLQVMVKTMPKNSVRVAMIQDTQLFVKEIKMYEFVLPSLIQFQKDCGITEEELFSPWPKFYKARTTESGIGDYVVLQDLRCLNYSMASRHEGLGFEESKLVMQSLGKFHALSYSQFSGNFDRLKSAYPFLKEKMFLGPEKTPEASKEWIRETFKREAAVLKNRDPALVELSQAVEGLLTPDYLEKMHRFTNHWTEVAVINHADCWTNNILFQFEPNVASNGNSATKYGRIARDLKFVDFQLSRVGSRCLDLGYFMYTSPKIDVLNEKEEELLSEYFEAFTGFCKRLGHFDPKLTLDQLLREYDHYRLFGISIGLMLAPIISAQSGDIPDLETVPEREEDRLSEESKSVWFGHIDKEETIYTKIHNIASKHISKIPL